MAIINWLPPEPKLWDAEDRNDTFNPNPDYQKDSKDVLWIWEFKIPWEKEDTVTNLESKDRDNENPDDILSQLNSPEWWNKEVKVSNNYVEKESLNNNEFQENSEIKESIESLELNQSLKELPSYPLIEHFEEMRGEEIPMNDKVKILTYIYNNIDTNINFESPLDSLDIALNEIWTEFEDEELTLHLSNYINHVRSMNENREQWEEVSIPEEFEQYDFLDNTEDSTVKLLAENYTILPQKNWSPDVTQSMETMFEVTANKIIDRKQFKRTEGFDVAMNDIKTWTIEDKFQALKYIFSLVNTTEWVKWVKTKNSYDKIKSKHDKEKTDYLDYKIWKLKTLLQKSQEENNIEESEQLEDKINDLEEKKSSWDVFEVWELDLEETWAEFISETN